MDSIGNIVLYCVITLSIVIFSVMTVFSRKILRSATYLLFVLFATAALYFQLGYQFLGAVQIAVYAGGILVLFVFSIALTSKPNEMSAPMESRRRITGLLSAVVGAALLMWALFSHVGFSCNALAGRLETGIQVDMKVIGNALLGTEKFQYLLPFEAISVLLLACIIGGIVVARKR